VIGYDRRFSPEFATRVAEVLAGNGFEVVLTPEPTPTPSVSFAVKALNAIGGVMITASHNPPSFNGYKLKSHFGGSADPMICQAVERCLDGAPVKKLAFAESVKQKKVRLRDVRPLITRR
jgi:phosphomannomutase